jgi:flagellar hook-length control protein FliK
MAGTTAVHSYRSHESSSNSTGSSTRSEKTSDDFDKKLAKATKKTQAPVAKAVTANPPKNPASKAPAEDTQDKSPADEDKTTEQQDQPTDDQPSPVIVGKTVTPVKAKSTTHTEADASADAKQPAKATVKTPVAPVDPDAGKQQGQKRPETKAKTPASTENHSLDATGVNQAAHIQTANDTTDNSPETDEAGDSDSQQSAYHLTTQPTFGVTTTNGLSASNSGATDQRVATPAAGDSKGENSAATGDGAEGDAGTFASAIAAAVASVDHGSTTVAHTTSEVTPTETASVNVQAPAAPITTQAATKSAGSVATSVQAKFVEDNHPKIVTGISGQLMPKGGTMQLRLDPEGLGAVDVTVHIHEGSMSAEFATSSEEATRMLSHSLGQLKSTLESAGMSVEKLHVEQAPKREGQANSGDRESNSATHEQQQQAQQEKQRRETMQRLWAKLAGGDPLDMVA